MITTSLVVGGVYTKRYLNVLFSSYVINLGVLSVVVRDLLPRQMSLLPTHKAVVVASLISLGVATATSLSIVGYHTFQKVKVLRRRLHSLCKRRGVSIGRSAVPNYQALDPCVRDTNEDNLYVTASTSSDLEIPRNLQPPLSATYREPQLMDYDST